MQIIMEVVETNMITPNKNIKTKTEIKKSRKHTRIPTTSWSDGSTHEWITSKLLVFALGGGILDRRRRRHRGGHPQGLCQRFPFGRDVRISGNAAAMIPFRGGRYVHLVSSVIVVHGGYAAIIRMHRIERCVIG